VKNMHLLNLCYRLVVFRLYTIREYLSEQHTMSSSLHNSRHNRP